MTIGELNALITNGDLVAVAVALRDNPAVIGQRTADGDSILHIACWQKQLGIVGTILGYGPDVNATGCYGRTPLHYAVHEGRWISVPIVGMLLKAGANPLIRDAKGFSVEDWAKIEMAEGLAEVVDMIHRGARYPGVSP